MIPTPTVALRRKPISIVCFLSLKSQTYAIYFLFTPVSNHPPIGRLRLQAAADRHLPRLTDLLRFTALGLVAETQSYDDAR